MNIELLDLLRCPVTGQRLRIVDEKFRGSILVSGNLITEDNLHSYPIKDSIPRFVDEDNYANNFGMQWNKFRKTQLDSYSGHSISEDRFYSATGWSRDDLNNKLVLDVGCGAGRFAEIALKAGAKVVALDYSSSVDACLLNLGASENLMVVQGDIYALPFPIESFDYVYSLGVMQHTPDVKKAFMALPPIVKKKGKMCVDFYWRRFVTVMHAKYFFRVFTKNMDQEKLFKIIERNIANLLKASRFLASVPLLGIVLKRMVPVADYSEVYPLNESQLKEWGLLDTFDMLSPRYDNPQTVKTAKRWMQMAGMKKVEVFKSTLLVARGEKL